MARPKVMPKALEKTALAIFDKNGMVCNYLGQFEKQKEGLSSLEYWDRTHVFEFFSSPEALQGCCGVIELFECSPPPEKRHYPVDITPEEWQILFSYTVRRVLAEQNRRMAIATLIDSQKALFPFFEAAGFQKVSQGYNPGTRNKITVWMLSI